MSVEYSFDVISLDVKSSHNEYANVVSTVVVRHTATNANNVSVYVDVGIRLDNPSEEFIQLENLTQEDVISWVQNSMWDLDEKVKAELNRKLESATSSVLNVTPPWSN
jgi:hypothetical protein